MSKVLVLVPCFNSVKFLQSNLDSILAQTFKDYCVLYIDGGSTDNTPTIIKSFERENIKAVCSPIDTLRAGRTLNWGLTQIPADWDWEYEFRLDADDMMKPDCLSRLFQEMPGFDCVYSDFEWWDMKDDETILQKHTVKHEDYRLGRIFDGHGQGPSRMNTRKIRVAGNGWMEYGHEDWTQLIIWELLGAKMKHIGDDLFIYRYKPSGIYQKMQKDGSNQAMNEKVWDESKILKSALEHGTLDKVNQNILDWWRMPCSKFLV